MAGALSHSGYKVPGAIKGNPRNPSGFFEPRWVVNLHRRLLGQTGVHTLDSDPDALRRLDGVLTDASVRAEIEDWLAPKLEEHRRIVIKDPRMVWFRDLWVDVAHGLGVEPRFVFMLRHPSEVSSSRTSYYNADEVVAVAGWVNVALMTERLTAGSPRALVAYPSLTAEWRTEMSRVRDLLGIPLDPAPEVRPHPVDDFIDPKLRRMRPGWEDSDAPTYLQDLGDRAFDALLRLTEDAGDSVDDEVGGILEELREEYSRAYAGAYSMVRPRVARDREQAASRARAELRKEIRARGAEAAAQQPPAPFLRRAARSVRRRLTRRGGS
jgi:hypothetical protein